MSYIQPTNHIQFILRPETAIIKEAFRSLDATNGGIETYPISDYLLHSLFAINRSPRTKVEMYMLGNGMQGL